MGLLTTAGCSFDNMDEQGSSTSLATIDSPLLQHLDLTDRLSCDKDALPLTGGAYSVVRVGTCDIPERGIIKIWKVCPFIFALETILGEVRVWSKLKHANVLELLGFSREEYVRPRIVTQFMENGNAWDYVQLHPDLDVTHMILGIAEGLRHLHDNDVIHSDLRSVNVLISNSGEPLIYGFCQHWASRSLDWQDIGVDRGPDRLARWLSPELVDSFNDRLLYTKASNTWAFGMTVYEHLTRKQPYYQYSFYGNVLMAITNGRLPDRPGSFPCWPLHYRVIWNKCEECWSYEPGTRPTMDVFTSLLKDIASELGPVADAKQDPVKISADAARVKYGKLLLQRTLDQTKHLDITKHLTYDKTVNPQAGGSYCDIRVAMYNTAGSHKVKIIEKELWLWWSFNHANVLPLIGYIMEETGFPSFVSEFMENGTVWDYVQQNPDLNVIYIILGIAKGVRYLHDEHVIHSDLKSDNVLVSNLGQPLICDFGMSRTISATIALRRQRSSNVGGSTRWMSPELLSTTDEESTSASKESDIWAFAMTVYELLTKKRPYYQYMRDLQVLMAITNDILPGKPEVYSAWPAHYHEVWKLCEECWSKEPSSRPRMDECVTRLRGIVAKIE